MEIRYGSTRVGSAPDPELSEFERKHKADAETIRVAALTAWVQMSDKDRAIVRHGMIPLWAHEMHCPSPDEVRDSGRLFAVALMDHAKRNGGMVA